MDLLRGLTRAPERDEERAPVHPALRRIARSLGIRRAPPGRRGIALQRGDEPPTGAAPGPRAVVGSDGWLFLTGDTNDVLGQHTGAVRPGPAWRRGWSRLLARRVGAMRDLGAEWVHLVAPDKESVYAEKLPAGIDLVERRPVHDFIEIARELDAQVLYPLTELQEAKSSGLVYFETDTHWTALGGHIAYRLVCDELARLGAALPEDAIEWADTVGPGDLGSKLEPSATGRGVRARVLAPRARLVSDNRVRGTGRVCAYESDRAAAPTGVIFGTCFAIATLGFFKESFRRLVFVHSAAHDELLLRQERPDVVITLTAERGLRLVPDDRGAHRRLAKMQARKPATEGSLVEEERWAHDADNVTSSSAA